LAFVLHICTVDDRCRQYPHQLLHDRQGESGLYLAIQHIDLAEDLIGERSYDVAPTEVLRLAVDSDCSAYDSHYAALAQQLDVPLVTHDGEVLEAFPETAVHPDDFLGQ
jgi:predicted nucleic acid-binding protein